MQRWQNDLNSDNEQIHQLAIDEIALMLKRFSLSGWQPILVNKTSRTHKNSVSRHAQFYVSQMLEFIAVNYDQMLTIDAIAEHVKLNPNYAMGIFQRVMQLTMKQYITAMRINHVRALLQRHGQNHTRYCAHRRVWLQQPFLQYVSQICGDAAAEVSQVSYAGSSMRRERSGPLTIRQLLCR